MFQFIRKFIEHRQRAKLRLLDFKKRTIFKAVLKYFEDLQGATGEADLPPFIKTQSVMSRFVRTEKDINRIYRNLQKA